MSTYQLPLKKILINFIFLSLFFSHSLYAASPFTLLIIDSSKGMPYQLVSEKLIEELAHLGYKQGENLYIEYYSLSQHPGMINNVWSIESKKNYSAIFVNGTLATMGMAQLALDAPHTNFVFATVAEIKQLGLVKSCNELPLHNFTGVCLQVDTQRLMDLFHTTLPSLKSLGMFYTDTVESRYCKHSLETLIESDKTHPINFISQEVPYIKSDLGYLRMIEIIKPQLSAVNAQVEGFIASCDYMNTSPEYARMMGEMATVPFYGLSYESVMKVTPGATLSLFPDLKDIAKKSAVIIEQIFKGKAAKEIIPLTAENAIAINKKLAKRFHLNLPNTLIQQANKNIIE